MPEGLIARLQLRQSRQGELEFGGLQGHQHLLCDGGIEQIAAQVQAFLARPQTLPA
jgi:hypothetical protein